MRLQVFNTIAEELNLPQKKRFQLDCPMRWNSTCEMIQEAMVYKEALSRYAANHASMYAPSLEEWREAEVVGNFLESFLDSTKAFSMVRNPSSHTYIKEVWGIRSLLLDDEVKNHPLLLSVSKLMLIKFSKYWEEPNLILTLACVFDPRSKLSFVEYFFMKAYGNSYVEKVESIRLLLKSFFEKYEGIVQNPGGATTSESSQMNSPALGKKKRERDFAEFQSQNRHLHPKRSELDNYLEEDLYKIHDNENFDILRWRKNSELYPTLARMARDFLAIQVSTVSSESAFSAAGRLINDLRNSMGSETVEALICAKDWFGPETDTFNLEDFCPFMSGVGFKIN